jgi:2-keto-3-deoxy-L-rhamnonate aldolase RhmA
MLSAEDYAMRAYNYTLEPRHNPLKRYMEGHASVVETPPMLGIFNDIPWNKIRESDVAAWAAAGFTWIVNDAEHHQWEGWYSEEANHLLLRYGLLGVQRLHREALSQHGDAFQLGARATMRPYATTLAETEDYLQTVQFPIAGKATPLDRGGYPVRKGDKTLSFTPDELRSVEAETQAFVQFETAEYIMDESLRDQVLNLMANQGKHKCCGFIGPFDAIMREGPTPEMAIAVNNLIRAATAKGLHIGRVVGSGSMTDPADIEDAMVEAMNCGCRMITAHEFTSDFALKGARSISEPFFRAAERCGFSRLASCGQEGVAQRFAEGIAAAAPKLARL